MVVIAAVLIEGPDQQRVPPQRDAVGRLVQHPAQKQPGRPMPIPSSRAGAVALRNTPAGTPAPTYAATPATTAAPATKPWMHQPSNFRPACTPMYQSFAPNRDGQGPAPPEADSGKVSVAGR